MQTTAYLHQVTPDYIDFIIKFKMATREWNLPVSIRRDKGKIIVGELTYAELPYDMFDQHNSTPQELGVLLVEFADSWPSIRDALLRSISEQRPEYIRIILQHFKRIDKIEQKVLTWFALTMAEVVFKTDPDIQY